MTQIIETVINLFFNIYYILILVRAFLPYIPHNRLHPFLKPVYDVTEPLLSTIRKGLPPARIGIDASPFIAIILLFVLQKFIFFVLYILMPANKFAMAGGDIISSIIRA